MTGMIRKKKTSTSAGRRKGKACSPPSRIAANRRPGGFSTTLPGATVPLLIRSLYPLVLAAERILCLLLELTQLAVHARRILDHVLEQRAPVLAERAREEVGAVEDEGRRACDLRGLLLDQLVRVRGRLHALVRRDDGAVETQIAPASGEARYSISFATSSLFTKAAVTSP